MQPINSRKSMEAFASHSFDLIKIRSTRLQAWTNKWFEIPCQKDRKYRRFYGVQGWKNWQMIVII